jgi:hypothetical protein
MITGTIFTSIIIKIMPPKALKASKPSTKDVKSKKLTKKQQQTAIKKSFGEERFDKIIHYCIQFNVKADDDAFDVLDKKNDDDEEDNEEGCYLCGEQTDQSTEYCCNKLVCEKHTIWQKTDFSVCFLCCLKCSKCDDNWCAKGRIVCKDCLDDEDEAKENWEKEDKLNEFVSKASKYLK